MMINNSNQYADNLTEFEQQKKLRRQIEDYLRKYASIKELRVIADFLGIEQKEVKK